MTTVLRMPTPPSHGKYDLVDQADFRRTLESWAAQMPSSGDVLGVVQKQTIPVFNVKNYGAVGNSSGDDAAAIQAAVVAATAVGGITYFPVGTYMVSVAITLVAGARNILMGAGLDSSVIKRTGGGTALDWSGGTHVTGSFGSRIQDISFDGNNGAGPVVQISNLTMFRMERVNIYGNGASGAPATAIGLKLVSMYDSEFRTLYISTCGGGAASNTTTPCVLLDCDSTAANNFNNCQFYDVHIEPGPQDGILLYLLGNVTNPITDNQFYGLKTHGDLATGRPDNAVVKISQFSNNNRFFGHVVGFGKSTTLAQIECDGSRHVWYDPTFGIGGSFPKYAVNFSANGDSNVLFHPSFKTPGSYLTACVNFLGTKCKMLFPPGNFTGATLFVNGATGTVVMADDTGAATGLVITAGQGVNLPTVGFNGTTAVAKPTGFGTPTGAARLINYPGATATLVQTSGALADLLTLLKTYGLVGA